MWQPFSKLCCNVSIWQALFLNSVARYQCGRHFSKLCLRDINVAGVFLNYVARYQCGRPFSKLCCEAPTENFLNSVFLFMVNCLGPTLHSG